MSIKCIYIGMLEDGTVTDVLQYYLKGSITFEEMNQAIDRIWDNKVKINPQKVHFDELREDSL